MQEYLKNRTGFDFLIIGNSITFQDVDGEFVADGEISPGYNASMLFNCEVVSIKNKANVYSGRIVLSDKEESRNRDLNKNKDYLLINLQASKKHIAVRLAKADGFIQNNQDPSC